MATFAEFERNIIRERTMAGLDRARAQGKTLGRPRGKRSNKDVALEPVREYMLKGYDIRTISKLMETSKYRIEKAIKKIREGKQGGGFDKKVLSELSDI